MALLKKSDEERAAKEEERAVKAKSKEEARQQREFENLYNQFVASPAGQARAAFDRGDHVFQFSINVMDQDAIVVAMIGSNTSKKHHDPSAVINSVCHEGWELVNGDFVFQMTGQQSRDKFMSSGQNVAVAGMTVGYYLFKRCPENRQSDNDEDLRHRLWAQVVPQSAP